MVWLSVRPVGMLRDEFKSEEAVHSAGAYRRHELARCHRSKDRHYRDRIPGSAAYSCCVGSDEKFSSESPHCRRMVL